MGVTEGILNAYQDAVGGLSTQGGTFVNLILITALIVIYALLVWKFYIFISTKDILKLNLNRYNTAKDPSKAKLIAGVFYFIEYIIILPILIFFWFAVFTLLLVIMTRDLGSTSIIFVAAVIVAAIRVTSYIPKYGETVSSEVAKIVPLTLLAIGITDPAFFNSEAIIQQISSIPEVFSQMQFFILFIIVLELTLRLFTFIYSLFKEKISGKIIKK